jgi:hypothetical protein
MKRSKKTRNALRAALALLLAVVMMAFAGCGSGFFSGDVTTPQDSTGSPDVTTKAPSDETTAPNADETTDPFGDDTTLPPEDTTAPGPDVPPPTYIDPLTGLEGLKDVTSVRPIALFYDNVSSAAPQSGIAKADVLIEVMVEGGISRLIAITNDYDNNTDVFGPIRSARPYMVELSAAFDSLMVGAGYSDQGYASIVNNGLQYINGVHDRYAGSWFFRDPERVQNFGYTHSLMITSKGIKQMAQINSFETTLGSIPNNFSFVQEGKNVALNGGRSTHVILSYSNYQQVQFIYSASAGTYYRYQFGDRAHLDAETGEQLNFKNLFVLFTQSAKIEGDTEGRLDVETVGSGTGYYITGGKYAEIKWTRNSETGAFKFTTPSGMTLTVNRGKSFIAMVDEALKDTSAINLNFKLG